MRDKIKIDGKTVLIVVTLLLFASIIFFAGMKLVSAAGTCSGTPDACFTHPFEPTCLQSGCSWLEVGEPPCFGTPSACSIHSAQNPCEDAGCDWSVFYVNVGDVWEDVENVYVNIGDTWQGV